MKRILMITTAMVAAGALAACGDNAKYSEADEAEQRSEYAEETTADDYAAEDYASDEDDYAASGYENSYGTTDDAVTGDVTADTELEQRLAEADTPTISYNGKTYLTDAALNIRELQGAAVEGNDGDKIASVDDVIFTADGRADRLVLSSGGFAGIGDKQVTIAFNDVDLTITGDDDMRVISPLSETAIDSAVEYDEDAVTSDLMLASDMLGSEVALGSEGETASIHDVILENNGTASWLVLDTGLGGERYLVDFAELIRNPADADEDFSVGLSADRLKTQTRINYF